ncbi:MAG: DUF357 domain-containing protein [Methanolinea sp.]|nr:DUF357 domain-containing protein [Methanolinea sp.]
MTLSDCRSELHDRLGGASFPPCPGTALYSLAYEFRGMAVSYQNDGDYFLESGDPVNALASWSYALGWLDAGGSLGILALPTCSRTWFFHPMELSDECREHLQEKVLRYERLLSMAIESAGSAPEIETVMGLASFRFRSVAFLFLTWGRSFLSHDLAPNALASFSYGHAWMDAGVRSGLFFIKGSRDLFTV